MSGGESTKNMDTHLRVIHDCDTDMGVLMLRRRWSLTMEQYVFEMTMDGKLMMSSAVADSERALAQRALALLPDQPLRVLIGGLGFGFTTQTALADPRVAELTVIERLATVIAWHREAVLPWSAEFIDDPRLSIREDDFFATVAGAAESRYDAILIDIDDSPDLLWHPRHATFYASQGLQSIQTHLLPGGILAIWCAAHPGDEFVELSAATFAQAELVEIHFQSPCVQTPETNYLLLATAHA